MLARDFFETVTLSGTRIYVLAVIEHQTRGIRVLGATAHPTASWVTQTARNVVMDLEDTGRRARFLIRDRDGKFPELFDAILADAGVKVVLTGIQMPRMNAITERWVQTCRRELLDRTLIWNPHHLLYALRQFETSTTPTAPTRAPRTPGRCIRCRSRSPIRARSLTWTYDDANVWAKSSMSTNVLLDLHG